MDNRIKSVIFDAERHHYCYNGRQLHGVTGAICQIMGKSFPDTEVVKLATMYGTDVHKDIENYYNNGGKVLSNDDTLSTEAAKWVVSELSKVPDVTRIECEVMVSDFDSTASQVDVVMHLQNGTVRLYDIKTTSHFDRAYCSIQLSVYKRLYEACYGEKVSGLFVLGTKARRTFRIIEQDKNKVQKILDYNKNL